MRRSTSSGQDRRAGRVKQANRRLLAAVDRSILAAEQAKTALAELYRLADAKRVGGKEGTDAK